MAFDRLLVAQTMGGPDLASEHFGDALAFCLKARCRPELAWTCYDYADTLLQQNERGDRFEGVTSSWNGQITQVRTLVSH